LGRRSANSIAVDTRAAAFAAANAAESKKAKGTIVLDVTQVTSLADYFVIASGDTPAQVRAIVDAVDDVLEPMGLKTLGIEGKSDARWVLLDYGDIIVHVLHEKERGYYKLEQFWNHALLVDESDWRQEEE
jgi:ribosome-associated protein